MAHNAVAHNAVAHNTVAHNTAAQGVCSLGGLALDILSDDDILSDMLCQLIYRSRVARRVRFADAEAIAAAAAKNNARSSVSGLLLYTPTYFLQVLEGGRIAVESTFACIGRDDRHEEIVTLAKRDVQERQFGNWAMRAVTPSREVSAAVIGELSGDAALELLLSSR